MIVLFDITKVVIFRLCVVSGGFFIVLFLWGQDVPVRQRARDCSGKPDPEQSGGATPKCFP